MALILSSHGNTVTLSNFSIRLGSQQTVADLSKRVEGSRAVRYRSYGQREGSQALTLTGTLKGASATALDTSYDSIANIMNGGDVLLEDSTLDRFAVVRKIEMNRDYVPTLIYQITINLVILDGTWFDDPDDENNTTQAVITDSAVTTAHVRYVNVTYNGTASRRPRFHAVLDASGSGTVWDEPTIEWRGTNLFKNSSFEDGVNIPDEWASSNAPEIIQHFGRTGVRCVRVSRSGSTYLGIQYTVEVDASTEYTLSAYVRDLGTDATFRFSIQEQDEGNTNIGTPDTDDTAITESTWTRPEYAKTSHAEAAFWVIILQCHTDGEELDVDDVQLELGATATEFVNTSDEQYQHVSFQRSVLGVFSAIDTTQGDNPDEWSVDMVLGKARLLSSAWNDDNHKLNGHFFELQPGLNMLYLTWPSAGTITINVDHPDIYL